MLNKSYHSLLRRNDLSTAAKHHDMRRLFLFFFWFAFFLPISTVVADEVPSFDVAPSCRAAVSIGTRATPFTACIQKEKEAHDQLKAQWAQLTQANKAHCIEACNCGGLPTSYVELLTCLQMANDARMLQRVAALHQILHPRKNRDGKSELPITNSVDSRMSGAKKRHYKNRHARHNFGCCSCSEPCAGCRHW